MRLRMTSGLGRDSTHVTYAENAITNGIEIFEAPSGSLRVMTSNNDMWLRIFDTETFLCCRWASASFGSS